MFRKRNLLRDGVPAEAVVVDAAPPSQTGYPWSVRLLVHFDDGTSTEISRKVDNAIGRKLVAGDVLSARYDPKDRSQIELDLAAVKGSTQPEVISSAPTAAELQSLSDAWDAARAKATERMEAYQQAKAAGDTREAERLLSEGKVFNAEQIRLGDELKRLRSLRPD